MNKTILLGRVGSHAYGLAHEGSDEDFLGIFVAPTCEIAGLHWGREKESIVSQSPGSESNDSSLHEVGKYLRLALKVNPTVTELLWLQPDEYVTRVPISNYLIEIRESFLSEKYVRAAYRGYAFSQLEKFIAKGEFKAKHARHCLRLIHQGKALLKTGQLEVRVPDPQIYWDLLEMTDEQVLELLRNELDKFDNVLSTPLQELPDDTKAIEVLKWIRLSHLE